MTSGENNIQITNILTANKKKREAEEPVRLAKTKIVKKQTKEKIVNGRLQSNTASQKSNDRSHSNSRSKSITPGPKMTRKLSQKPKVSNSLQKDNHVTFIS